MTNKELTSLSKFLSLILRHKPEAVNLSLDEYGYISINDLINSINTNSKYTINHEILDTIVSTDEKQRYSYDSTKTRIRANQGHSIQVNLNLTQQTPPEILYHGTSKSFLQSIFTDGLKPMSRQYVHLSSDITTAYKVGKRHCKNNEEPVILMICALDMHNDEYKFYLSENNVWLTDNVPTEYIGNATLLKNKFGNKQGFTFENNT